MEGNTTLEITWTVVPLFIVVIFAYLGGWSLGEVNRTDPQALVINVKAQQFTWTFEYPEYGIISNELHLPVNRQVVLKMTSVDVIHSFWVPEFRLKKDVVPGRVNDYRITPILTGQYKVRCAELCGTSHAWLGIYGKEEKMSDGSTLVIDDAYLIESILNPNAKIVAGFPSPSVMPAFTFTDEQLANIIAYLKTLK